MARPAPGTYRKALASGGVGLALAVEILGCATAWEQTSTYGRALETTLEVVSEPSATVYVNGEERGTTPTSLVLRYREQMAIDERRASYFRIKPFEATMTAIGSYGFALPSELLPSARDSRDRPLGRFEGADFVLELRRPGFEPWRQQLRLSGEESLRLESKLDPLDGPLRAGEQLP
jgi:hypothetical protein